ncbi:MAG: Lrp/AsnC ligand binding domain-containing protein [Nitrososphaera sp.]|nr:Lrp/AsnC ligand binding domain-containing protein [Nitrososphaera sp.]
MINTMPGMERKLVDEIADIPGVISVEGVYGDFDLIVRIEVPVGTSIDGVINQIRKMPGLKSTRTVSSIEGERKSGTAMDHQGEPSD